MRRSMLAALAIILAGEVQAMDTKTLGSTDLAALRWNARPVLLLAAEDDPRRAEQLRLFEAEAAGMAEREMPVILGTMDEARRLLPGKLDGAGDFAVVLIGKDGGVKKVHDAPVQPAAMFETVDAMPMRQQEMDD